MQPSTFSALNMSIKLVEITEGSQLGISLVERKRRCEANDETSRKEIKMSRALRAAQESDQNDTSALLIKILRTISSQKPPSN